ncbi:hypothetical protein CANCADRAFT_43891 [Tortispora caseinolytica NRRL Y-17796]|uniref:Uncharacterized protein n=1 Tax=Tortispora caseinolytica NRRL Y-17796 TaxID=767744 RepID=A0A1E4TET2_9ASCO|nr:hypothetical protein CANCADRAFT_43891 [Tortispora caseinolytica NRRL Y-17796]
MTNTPKRSSSFIGYSHIVDIAGSESPRPSLGSTKSVPSMAALRKTASFKFDDTVLKRASLLITEEQCALEGSYPSASESWSRRESVTDDYSSDDETFRIISDDEYDYGSNSDTENTYNKSTGMSMRGRKRRTPNRKMHNGEYMKQHTTQKQLDQRDHQEGWNLSPGLIFGILSMLI